VPLSLWMVKSELSGPIEETAPMRRGRHLEEVAIEMLREERPDWIVSSNAIPGGRFYRDLDSRMSCTPDAFVAAPGRSNGVCQVKSVQQNVFRKRWKNDAGEVEPPLFVEVQAMQEAALTGATWACVAALVVDYGIDLHIIDIPLHEGVLAKLREATTDFWRAVESKTPPGPDYAKDGAAIAALYGQDDGSVIALDGDNSLGALASEDEILAAELKAREIRRKEIKAEVLSKLGPHAIGTVGGRVVVTAKTVHRAGYTVKPTTYRNLHFPRSTAS